MRRLSLTGSIWLAAAAALAAASRIDHRFAPRRAETLIAARGHQAVVTPEGGLRFGDGATLAIAPTGAFAFAPEQRPVQRLVDDRLPIVRTIRESGKLAMEATAFAAPSPPMACVEVVVRNKTGGAIAPVLRIQADKAHGTLAGKHAGFERQGQLVALIELRKGKGEVVGAARPKRHVFRREGGRALPNWGRPKVACDAGFRHIVAGFSEPATYHMEAPKGKRYIVAVGLCESHWKEAGKRICDILVEGQRVARIDPIAKPYGPDVPFVRTFPAPDRNGDGWITVTSVAAPGSPDVNSIVNVLWLFEESVGRDLSPADIVSGKANRLARCYVDCGGPVEAPGPATLDYRVELPPNGSATLWLKRPFAPVKVADAAKLAALDLTRLFDATAVHWRNTLGRGATVRLSDPAPAHLVDASLINLLALRTGAGAEARLAPVPFDPAFSPRASALGALALDRMGFHGEAAALLGGVVANLGSDRLWHEGADAANAEAFACATGLALWALVSHYQLTDDEPWLAANYKPILRAAEALIDACDYTKWSSHNPLWHFHGIMPPTPYRGLPADHWFVHDFWAMTGLRCAAHAARALDKPNDYKWLEDHVAEYGAVLRRTVEASRVYGPAAGCLPAAAGEASQWTFASCVAALYPAPTAAADPRLLSATFRYLDQRSIEHLPGGIDGQSAAVEVPLACQYALARLAGGDAEAALAAFVSIANVSSPAASFPERIDLRSRRAAGPMPSAAATASYILLLREMLVREEGDTLHLGSCVPTDWLAEGLAVENLPTTFGRLSFRASLEADGRKLVVEPRLAARRPVKALVVHPPLPRGAVEPHTARDWEGEGRVEINLGN